MISSSRSCMRSHEIDLKDILDQGACHPDDLDPGNPGSQSLPSTVHRTCRPAITYTCVLLTHSDPRPPMTPTVSFKIVNNSFTSKIQLILSAQSDICRLRRVSLIYVRNSYRVTSTLYDSICRTGLFHELVALYIARKEFGLIENLVGRIQHARDGNGGRRG